MVFAAKLERKAKSAVEPEPLRAASENLFRSCAEYWKFCRSPRACAVSGKCMSQPSCCE